MFIKQLIGEGDAVAVLMYIFIGLSVFLFLGMGYFFVASKRPGVYPPKMIQRQRAAAFALGGIVSLFIGFIFRLFQ
jgi:hypothetical protein